MDIHINYEEFFMVLLTSITISVVAVVIYAISIILWGKAVHFGYIRLFFTSNVIGGGVFNAYFIHINNGGFFTVFFMASLLP